MFHRHLWSRNEVHINLYGCRFLLSYNDMEIKVTVKGMIYCDSCTSVVPNTCAHTEMLSEMNTFRV